MQRCFAWAMVSPVLAAWSCGARPEGTAGAAASALSDTPDYVITTVSGPPSATPGSLFNVTTTVCNVGGAFAFGTGLQIVMTAGTTDTTLTDPFQNSSSPDFIVGGRSVGWLWPGQCDTATTDAFAPPATGALYLGASVSPGSSELIESNNLTTGPLIGFDRVQQPRPRTGDHLLLIAKATRSGNPARPARTAPWR